LRRQPADTESVLRVRLRDIETPGPRERSLRLFWNIESDPPRPLAVQEHTITEWAAVAVACVVLARYAARRVRAVAVQGDRFDYWLTDGDKDFGLEVSGTQEEDLEGRHREKVRQLRANPYGVDGYVAAVRFATAEALLSFHRFTEHVP
jgi:hypothetical protein